MMAQGQKGSRGAAQPWRAAAATVVVLTTSKADEDVLRAYRLHTNCYINKPVDLDQFIRVVQSIQDFWLTVVRLPPKSAS